METTYERACRTVSRRLSWTVKWLNLEWDKKLEAAIEETKMNVSAEEVTCCAWASALLAIIFSSALSLLLYLAGHNPLALLLAGFILAVSLAYYISTYPKMAANTRKLKSLGAAPELVAYMIIPLKGNPNLEDAVRFAAEHGEGAMAEDLRKVLRDVWAGEYRSVGEALPVLGYKWGEDIKGFSDAMCAIRTSQIEKSEARRLDALDRALDCVLDSIQKKFEEFVSYLRLPTMLIFAGGALLPLIVIILLPLVSFMGLDFSTPENLALILAALVLGVFLFSEYTLTRRPAAFSPIRIPDSYPGLPAPGKMRLLGKEASAALVAVSAAAAVSLLSVPYFLGVRFFVFDQLSTLPVVVGVGLGLWLYLRGTALPKKELRDRLLRLEEETIEASFQLGNRLLAGMSAEEAFVRVAEMVSEQGKGKSPVSLVFEKAVRNIRYLNMGLEDSLFDPVRGALSEAYSGMVRSVFRIFATTMRKSALAASEALIVAATHIKQIRRVEDSLKEQISYTTSMMKVTAVFINPLICGLAVYISEVFRKTMAQTMSISSGADFGAGMILREPTTSPEMLQLIAGTYMLTLLFVLVRYVTVLEHGDDVVSYRLQVAKNIPIALSAFIGVIFISRLL
jgi:hypothetical protein